jgi:hypothetical protein
MREMASVILFCPEEKALLMQEQAVTEDRLQARVGT